MNSHQKLSFISRGNERQWWLHFCATIYVANERCPSPLFTCVKFNFINTGHEHECKKKIIGLTSSLKTNSCNRWLALVKGQTRLCSLDCQAVGEKNNSELKSSKSNSYKLIPETAAAEHFTRESKRGAMEEKVNGYWAKVNFM